MPLGQQAAMPEASSTESSSNSAEYSPPRSTLKPMSTPVKKLTKDASTQKTSPPRRKPQSAGKSSSEDESSTAAPNWLRLRAAWLGGIGLALVFAMRWELGFGPDIRLATSDPKATDSVMYFLDPDMNNNTVYRQESRQEITLNSIPTAPLETAFLASLAVFSLPAGLLVQLGCQLRSSGSHRWWLPTAPHQLLGASVLASCLLNLFLPATAIAASPAVAGYATAAIRIAQAAFESCVWPAAFAMWGLWATPGARGRLMSSAAFGAAVGSVTGVVLTGVATQEANRNSIAWLAALACGVGLAGCLWSGAWLSLSRRWTSEACDRSLRAPSSSADQNGPQEGLQASAASCCLRVLLTLKSMLTSGPVIGICLASGGLQWNLRLCAYGTVPAAYYRDTFGAVSLIQIWPRMTAPLVAMAAMTLIGGQLLDRISSSRCLSIVASRRLIVSLGFGCLTGCLATLAAAAGWHGVDAATALMTLGLAGAGLGASGLAVSHLDLAPLEAGLLAGLSSAVGNGLGVASHCVAHHVTQERGDPHSWRVLRGAAAGVQALLTLVFVLLCSAELPVWATSDGSSARPGEFNRLLEDDIGSGQGKPVSAINYCSISDCGAAGEIACQSEG